MTEHKSFEVLNKHDGSTPAEGTRNCPVYTPEVDIYEDEDGLTLIADLPGVSPKSMSVDLHEGILTLKGEPACGCGPRESSLSEEFAWGRYEREFKISDAIDHENINASLKDGVLTLRLPKAAEVKPRKIEVQAA